MIETLLEPMDGIRNLINDTPEELEQK